MSFIEAKDSAAHVIEPAKRREFLNQIHCSLTYALFSNPTIVYNQSTRSRALLRPILKKQIKTRSVGPQSHFDPSHL